MEKNIFILLGLLILFQAVDIFFVNDLTLDAEMIRGEKKFPAFETIYLDGEVATEKIFDGKITLLVLWTTRAEDSPGVLEKLTAERKNFPANVQIIGLAGDAHENNSESLSRAEEFAKKFPPNVRHLVVNDDFSPILSKIRTAPTTIFVDERGFLTGQPASGADVNFILRELNFILEKDSSRSRTLRKIQNIILNRQ